MMAPQKGSPTHVALWDAINAFTEASGGRTSMSVARQLAVVRVEKAIAAYMSERAGKTAFLAQRVAYHLAHGCDTAERARELALAEWDVGVMGVRK